MNIQLLVGIPRFERGVSCTQSRRIAKFSYIPLMITLRYHTSVLFVNGEMLLALARRAEQHRSAGCAVPYDLPESERLLPSRASVPLACHVPVPCVDDTQHPIRQSTSRTPLCASSVRGARNSDCRSKTSRFPGRAVPSPAQRPRAAPRWRACRNQRHDRIR